MMRRVRLGATTLDVSALGFGAATLGEEYGALSVEEGQRTVAAALDGGITFFDVSPYYGRTLAEERLGRALERKRDQVVLATKVGRYDRTAPDGFDFSAARVRRSAEESLRRLRTDVIDILFAHDVEFSPPDVIVGETIPALRRLQEEGKTRYIGITGFPLDVLRDLAEQAPVDVVLSYCHFSLLNTRMERVLAPFVREQGVGLINASPLHMGVLTGAGPPDWHPAPSEVKLAARAAADLCAARGADLADLALRFALHNSPASSTLVGMRSEAEVKRNLQSFTGPPDIDLLNDVRALLAHVQDVEWPSGIARGGGEAGRPDGRPPRTGIVVTRGTSR
ncbi:MAG: aldo/keto reductase [Gemmatimonadaceae bacterium]